LGVGNGVDEFASPGVVVVGVVVAELAIRAAMPASAPIVIRAITMIRDIGCARCLPA
jgi:hypothetical protein